MSTWIYWSVFALYLAFLAFAGIRAKKKTHTFEDYMVAGRNIGPVLLGISFGVTYFSAVMIVGGGEFSYIWGLSSIWIGVIDCLVGVFAAFILFGRRTMRLSEELGSLTVPEFLGKRYNSKGLQMFTACVTLVFETVYLVSIYMGLSVLLKYAMPNVDPDLSYTIAVCMCGLITIVYLNIGGAHGAIWTDAAEAVIMLAGVAAVFIAGLNAVGGIEGLTTTLTEVGDGWIGNSDALTTAPPGAAPMKWLGYVLVTSFGVWGMPQMISRYFTTKQKRSLKWGLSISIFWALVVSLFAWWNGAIGRAYYHQAASDPNINPQGLIGAFDEIIPALTRDVLSTWGAALFFAAITAASLTTGEKVIMIASGSFSRDFYQVRTGASDEKAMKVTQITNVFVVVIGVALALMKPDAVLALCMFAWAALASTTLIPYLYGLFWKKGTAKAAIITGAICLFLALFWKMGVRGFCAPATGCKWPDTFPFLPESFRKTVLFQWNGPVAIDHVHEFILSQIVAAILFPIISLLTQDDVPKNVDDMFDVMTERREVTQRDLPASPEPVEMTEERVEIEPSADE